MHLLEGDEPALAFLAGGFEQPLVEAALHGHLTHGLEEVVLALGELVRAQVFPGADGAAHGHHRRQGEGPHPHRQIQYRLRRGRAEHIAGRSPRPIGGITHLSVGLVKTELRRPGVGDQGDGAQTGTHVVGQGPNTTAHDAGRLCSGTPRPQKERNS